MRRLDDEVRIVRPLLQARRGELLELIEAAGVSVATDPTNERRDSARGMVRHEVLPRLEHLHPGATGRIAATAEEAGSLIRDGLENPRVPVPDSIRWSREVLAGLDEVTVSGSIRESIRSLPGIRSGAVEAVPRAAWSAMARAVLDEEERPREFELSGLGAIRVEARWIRWRSEPGRSDESPTLPS